MALTFDVRVPTARLQVRQIRSKMTSCMAWLAWSSSFTFILAIVMGVL